ncbi:MAG: hypothetical protein QNJ20_05690 [Paracoccaceae bacterium]|nr:hypothetical protein [Paracoccaceae bacterium]
MRYLILTIIAVVLAACSGGEPITDYEKRSVFYTWVDAREISGNRMTGFQIRNLSAPSDERYYGMGWEKLGTGYLVWHNGVTPGRYEFSKMWMMSCAGPLCTNTINEYSFGPLGSAVGTTRVSQPGKAVFAGCYAFKRTKRGFFRPGEFETRKAPCGASKAQMLRTMMPFAKHPMTKQIIQNAM